jgi:hypothetical protein
MGLQDHLPVAEHRALVVQDADAVTALGPVDPDSITLGTYSHLRRLAEDAAERTGARSWPYDRGWVAHRRQGETP